MEDFWKVNNPILYCWDITIPVMCLNATDDPIISKDLIPRKTFKEYQTHVLTTVDLGGHCGFIEEYGESWCDKVTLDFVLTSLDFVTQMKRDI